MIIAQLTGGLGNQLFQYAAAKSLSLHHNTELLIDTSSFSRDELPELEVPRDFEMYNFAGVFDKTIDISTIVGNKNYSFLNEKKIETLLPNYKRGYYKEASYNFDTNFFNSKINVFLKGGWQSYKYFEHYNAQIIESLQLKDDKIAAVKTHEILTKQLNSVSVHVRRGDYLRMKIIFEWHGVMEQEYYARAFEEILKKGTIDKVFYFSDDTKWVSENLLPIMDGEIVSSVTTKNQYEDFYLMQHCTHNIVANSSFSWWAAYLNPNSNKIVVAPKKWFNKAPYDTKDLIPQSWIRI
jgi:hypothetical protein